MIINGLCEGHPGRRGKSWAGAGEVMGDNRSPQRLRPGIIGD